MDHVKETVQCKIDMYRVQRDHDELRLETILRSIDNPNYCWYYWWKDIKLLDSRKVSCMLKDYLKTIIIP